MYIPTFYSVLKNSFRFSRYACIDFWVKKRSKSVDEQLSIMYFRSITTKFLNLIGHNR